MPIMNQIYKDGVPYGGTPIAQTFGSETELTDSYVPEVTDDYTAFPILESGTNSQKLWTKVAALFKNVRWLNKRVGNTALNTTNKEVSGAINELNTKLTSVRETVTQGITYTKCGKNVELAFNDFVCSNGSSLNLPTEIVPSYNKFFVACNVKMAEMIRIVITPDNTILLRTLSESGGVYNKDTKVNCTITYIV